MVWQTYKKISIPIIGMGGILTAADALEFILAGATAVSIGTALFVDPYIPAKVIEGIEAYMAEEGFGSVAEMVGLAHQ